MKQNDGYKVIKNILTGFLFHHELFTDFIVLLTCLTQFYKILT